jgi:hypothetical protein
MVDIGTYGFTARYTTDGTTPTETNGTVITGPITISTPCTLKAMAYQTGYTDSAVASAVYALQCYSPTFTENNPGTYNAPVTVAIESGYDGNTISYTTDGTTPTATHGTVIANSNGRSPGSAGEALSV